ncbi:MAG TPA: hypothetical protein VEK33_01745 [Terriglobales bacterium]|nr:hypothetical protein [Terriglobales bacterium]
MKPCWHYVCLIFILLGMAGANASDQEAGAAHPASSPSHISKETRLALIRTFDSELVYIRTLFPMGKKGLTLKDGVVSPSGPELQAMIATWGPSVKPGDQARISAIDIKSDRIHFEINGGPVKKQKWYQHIQVGGASGSVPVAPSDANANPRGSSVDLVFDHYVPELNPQELKQLLRPVFDFDAKSAVEAYLETVPPKARDAIKSHQVLVGMNREMVMYAKGRPPKKIREKDGETEYEDWIYGEPPQDVDFVRFVGDEVVRVETMKVSGEKMVRTEKEIDLKPQPSVAKASDSERPPNAPTLRRPGEELPSDAPSSLPNKPLPPPPASDPPSNGNPPNLLG